MAQYGPSTSHSENEETCLDQDLLERNAFDDIETLLCPHSRTVETDIETHRQETFGHLLRPCERMNTSTQLVLRVHLVENLDEVIITAALVQEKRKIHCSDNLELLSEILVLTLHIIHKEQINLLITEEESIIIQTKLADRNDLFHFLSLLSKRNQLGDDGIRLLLLELTATCWMNANRRVETRIRSRQSKRLLGFLQIASFMSRIPDTTKPVIIILDTPTFQARSSTSFRSLGCFTFPR